MKGLTRVDHEGKQMFGWLARVYGGGKTFSKYFSDKRYGSKDASREKAVDYLKQLTREVREKFADYNPRQNQPLFRKKPGSTNKTGVVGIHRCETITRGKATLYWAATWNEEGKPKDKKFYFRKDDYDTRLRSEEEAKKMAIEWRARKLLEISATQMPAIQKLKRRHLKELSTVSNDRLLKTWVAGLVIRDWSSSLGFTTSVEEREIKKLEKFHEKRVTDLIDFLGVSAALFTWEDIDYDFGRGLFKGDVRSRCFWNRQGIRTDVLVLEDGVINIIQSLEPDPYYLEQQPTEKPRRRRRRRSIV